MALLSAAEHEFLMPFKYYLRRLPFLDANSFTLLFSAPTLHFLRLSPMSFREIPFNCGMKVPQSKFITRAIMQMQSYDMLHIYSNAFCSSLSHLLAPTPSRSDNNFLRLTSLSTRHKFKVSTLAGNLSYFKRYYIFSMHVDDARDNDEVIVV